MAEQFTIMGIAGSLRKNSYNRAALKAAQQLAPAGATIDIFEIDGIPLFNQDEEIMIGNAAQKFDADGQLTDQKTVELIRKLLQVLVQRAGQNAK